MRKSHNLSTVPPRRTPNLIRMRISPMRGFQALDSRKNDNTISRLICRLGGEERGVSWLRERRLQGGRRQDTPSPLRLTAAPLVT